MKLEARQGQVLDKTRLRQRKAVWRSECSDSTTGWMLGVVVRVRAERRGVFPFQNVQAAWWDPLNLLFNEYRRLLWRESGHSSPSSAEVQNEWSYTTTLPAYLLGVYWDNFTFLSVLTF